jgi:hypothetical protein
VVWAGFVYRAQGSPVAPAAPAVSQGTSDTPAPTANPGGFGPRTEQTLWLETFDSDQLDPDRWRPVNNPQVVRPEGGRLNFVGRRSTSDPPINHDRIQPILPGWPIAEVSGKVTVHQAGGPRDGGITVFVAQKSGRTTGFAFGPSASRPVGEAWVCHKVTSCGVDYGNYVHAGNFPLKPDADNDFAIVQSGESVEVRAGGIVSRADPDPSPIAELWFSLDVAPADDWVATLDDLRVTRAT